MRAWLAPDAINTRVVFRVYAALAGAAGILLVIWGPMWLGADLADIGQDKAALIRLFGALLIAAACCAVGLAEVEDPPSRHRGLLWFVVAHATVWFLADWSSWSTPLGDWIHLSLGFTNIVLLMLWSTAAGQIYDPPGVFTTLLHRSAPTTTERLRAAYEQQIRQAARQEERSRLARDLHDTIKQQIFVIQTSAATAQVRFDSDREGASGALHQIRDSAREAMTEMEVMLDQFRSAPLENTGLVEALRKLCEALGFRTGARIEFEVGELPASATFVPGAQEAILRVAQEALANVARHARADQVRVRLESLADQLVLTVWDNGSGLDLNRPPAGMGIRNMQQRADEFDGSFEMESRPGGGTLVRFSVPFAVGKAEKYRGRAMILTALAAIPVVLAVWTGKLRLLVFGVFFAAAAARSAFAWRRLRRQNEAPL